MKLLAVDGNSILNRAFYGIRLLSAKDGTFTNGIYGFLTILLRMQQETNPDAVAIAFDMRAPTFRHKKYEGYKAQRKGMPEELAQQMPLLQELLTHLGYTIVMQEGWEADDLLGTLSAACCQKGDTCVIATGDRDSFQLISDCVTVRLASTKGGRPQADLYDPAAIMEKYGVEPPQLIDVKALMGDASDNIPGVAGIGEKTALSLIQQFGTLDAVYQDLDTLPIKEGVRTKLKNGKEMAYLSRELAVIDCEAPIEREAESYQRDDPDNGAAYGLMSRLELFSLMEKFGVHPEATASEQTESKPEAAPALELSFNTLPEELLSEKSRIDVLFEFEEGRIASLCFSAGGALYFWDKDLEDITRRILTAPAQKRTNQVKQLYHYGIQHGFEPANMVFDAEIAAYILNPTANDYSLGRLAGEYQIAPLDLTHMLGDYGKLPEQAAIFPALADKLEEEIKANGQYKLLTEMELPLAQVLAEMEHTGIALDTDGLQVYGEHLDSEISRLQAHIYQLAGEEFNINSPKQLGVILFEKLELPTGKKTKTGYSTNVDVLEKLKDKHPIVGEILEYRKVAKLKSTYVDGLMSVVGEAGRIHTTFQQTLTRTGRISSIEPNLQNIPVRTELGSELRRFFRAGDETLLLDADYSQIELRVLAHIAEDKNMIEAFQNGEDIHLNTAAQVFDLPPMFVTPLMRSRAKAVNFGIVYGIGAYSLSQDIGVSVSEADQYIKGYLSTYSGVKAYMEDIVEFGKKYGYVKTLFGRRRYLPELSSSNRPMKEFGKRVAMNTPIQGTAADIIKIAMVRVFNRLRKEGLKARLILQVHDELIVESPLDEVDRASDILHQEMEAAAELSAPLSADVNTGKTWLEAK